MYQQTVLQHVPINQLTPHPDNPRLGDVDKIIESIRTNGFFGALVAQQSTCYILAGNHRWKAAKQMGMETVPVIFVECNDTQARKILLADNRASDMGGYDHESLTTLLKTVMAADDLQGTGFDAIDLQQLIGDVNDEPNDKRKRNLEPFHHTFWLIRAPITAQGAVSELLTTHLSAIEGVEIASATH